MRVVCSALLLCLAALGCRQTAAYDHDKLYGYQFEGAVLARLANEDKPQYSGVAIKARVAVKKSAADELTLKLDAPHFGTVNDVVQDVDRPNVDYKPFENAASLDKPFKVYLDEAGSVRAFDVYKDEQKWVSNLKRGLLSFFQLKLKPDGSGAQPADTSSYYSVSEKTVVGECNTDYVVLGGEQQADEQPTASTLNVTKTRSMAKCKSRFMHQLAPIDADECMDDMQLLKRSNAIFTYSLRGSRANYVIERALLDERAVFSPFGDKAISPSMNTKFALTLDDANAAKYANIDMKVDTGSALLVSNLAYEPPETLNFYANVNLNDAHHLAAIYAISPSVEQVLASLNELVEEHRRYSKTFDSAGNEQVKYQQSSRLGELFMRSSELAAALNSAKLEALYQKIDELSSEPHKKVFWDLMSAVGTNPAFVFMKKLITDGDAPAFRIKDYLTQVSFHIKAPSKALFDEYVNLCKSDKIQANVQYKRLCSLPLASLVHQHCVKPHAKYLRMQAEGMNATAYKKAQNQCQIATAEEYFAQLVGGGSTAASADGSSGAPSSASAASSSVASSSGASSAETNDNTATLSVSDKMYNVKLAQAMGVKPTIETLMEIARNRDEHPTLRAAAVWGLTKVASIYPTQVKRLVVPFFFDRQELLELRIAAFYNWMFTGFSLPDFETVASSMIREPNRQLVLYLHSLIKSMAENMNQLPCTYSLDKYSKLVLPTFAKALRNHAPASLSDSRASISGFYQPEFSYGTASMKSLILSNDSFAPSNLFFSSKEFIAGLKTNPMEILVQAHGLDKLLKRVVGINGLFADKDSFMDVFSLKRTRTRRQAAAPTGDQLVKQEIAEIEKELKLATREFSDVYVSVTVSVYGRPVTFFDKDSRELKKMLSDDGTIKIPAIKKFLHSFSNHTNQQMTINYERLGMINNELGLPIVQQVTDFEMKTMKLNSVKFDVEPGFFRDERQGKRPTKISAGIDMRCGKHQEMLLSFSSLLMHTKQKAGVGFHKRKLVNLPLKVSLEANLVDQKITVKHSPIHENLLYIKQSPVTFVKSLDEYQTPQEADPKAWKPLYNFSRPLSMEPCKHEFMSPLALGVKVEGKHRAGGDWSFAALRRYLSSMDMRAAMFLYRYSPTGAPLEFRLSTVTTADNENPTNELTSIISWRHSGPERVEAPSGDDPVERELEAETGRDKPGKPTSAGYKLELVGGSEKARKVGLQVHYSRSFDRLAHKWRVFYQRTPLVQNDASGDATNLCWYGSAKFLQYDIDKLLNFELLDMSHSAYVSSEHTFGDTCTEKGPQAGQSHVSANLVLDWSAEQRESIEHALKEAVSVASSNSDASLLPGASLAQLYDKCKKRRAAGKPRVDEVCLAALQLMTELKHAHGTFDYHDVPARWTKIGKRAASLYTYARANYIDELDVDNVASGYENAELKSASDAGKPDRTLLDANLTCATADGGRHISYQLENKQFRVRYAGLPISMPPPSTLPLLGSNYYKSLQRRQEHRQCTVDSDSVTTFDNLTYALPPIADGCLKLVTKDCSPENNFAVLGAKVAAGKLVKVYVGRKFKVEFVPDKDGKSVAEIKINGEAVQASEVPQANKAPLVRHTNFGPRTVEAFSIASNGAYYTLSSRVYKFSVSTDGTWILVQQSKYYAGKSCGICGDANGDSQFEFKAPSAARKVCKSAADFAWAYVLPSTCASRPATIECV